MTDTRAAGNPVLITGETSFELIQDDSHDEKWLQDLIHRHPGCLPMDQIEPGFERLVPVCMELPVSGGYVDNLFMTPDGNIVIVEVKLWSNSEARRKVVAQALEYATGLFRMNYEALEKAVLSANLIDAQKPNRLYDMFSDDSEALPEARFIDRVNYNLHEGRIALLVVGNGIRTQLEEIYEGLQKHANFQFTFALVEMPVFRYRNDDVSETFVVTPRTLLRTTTVPRFTIQVKSKEAVQIDIIENNSESKSSTKGKNITERRFYEEITESCGNEVRKKLEDFVDKLKLMNVDAELKAGMSIKWVSPENNSVNLGTIHKDGKIEIESYHRFYADYLSNYVDDLSKVFEGNVKEKKDGVRYIVNAKNDKRFTVSEVMEKLDEWCNEIRTCIERIEKDSG